MTDARRPRSGATDRRSALKLGAVAALTATAGLAGARPAAAAPSYTPIPLLPGEVSRTDTRTTRLGKAPYECIDVVVGGDRARLYVPHNAPLKGRKPGGIVWFYHSNGSDYTAMDGAFNYPGMMVADQGAVAICPNFGGSLWTAEAALRLQASWSRWVSSAFGIGVAFARTNSGGGCLMSYAYGKAMVPALRGIYMANGTYDVEELYARDPGRVGPPYNNDPAAVAATNPARLPSSAWQGKRIKVIVSTVDPIVPPDRHGLALASSAQAGGAADVRIRYHDQGHVVPGWTHSDMMSTFNDWL